MAASGLDHLKNDYRRRFCRPVRVPDINSKQGQNILEILQDCFEENSLAKDFSTNSTKSLLYSTPKIGDICIQSPRKEAQCQKSHPKSVPVSLRKKEASLPFIVEPSEVNRSVQDHEVHQQILATDVGSKKTPDSRKMSSKKLKDHHSEADEKLYLSVGSPFVLLDAKASVSQNAIPSIAQKRETYTSENSVNTLSSSTEISLKTRKRLNFEDKNALKKVEIANKVSEIEDKVSEEPQERKSSRTSQKRVSDSEDEIQPQTKKSFSTLFLETVKRKSESSPIVRHIATAPLHSSPSNDLKLLEDEFIIDESERSFASRSWITVPRKAGPLKQCTVYPAESSALLQSKKSREKHHNVSPTTLMSDKHSDTDYPIEKSQPSEQKRLGRSCALTNELENHRSTKYEMYYENAEKSSGKKRTIKQKQRRKFKDSILEEQVDMEQSKDKDINMSHITQGSKKNSTNVPYTETQKKDKEYKKKHFPSGSKKNKLVPDEVTSTITRSRRISRRPSNWWVVKSEQSLVYSNSSRRNELSVCHNSRRKPAEKSNQSSKNIEEKTIPFKGQKRTTLGSSRAQEFLNTKDSGGIMDHDEISGCSQNASLENDEEDLAKKKNLDHSGGTRSTKDQDNMTGQNVHLKSQIRGFTCKTPAESNLDSGEPKTSVLEGRGTRSTKDQDNMTGQNVHLKSQIRGFTCKTPAESNLDSGEPKTSVLEGRGTRSTKDQDNMTGQNVHLKSQIRGFTCKTPAESNLDSGEPKTSVLEGRGTRSTKDQDNMTGQNVHLKSQIRGFTCKTPAESNLDSGEPKTSVLEGSGPFRLKNYLTSGKNNSDVDDKEVQESSILPSNTPNVRRTKRTRLKPLEYWRGERIDYHGRPSGGFVIGGILSPDTVSSKRKSKGNIGKVNKMVNRKRICLDNEERKNKLMVDLSIPLGDPLQPTRVKDPETREIIPMDLLRPRDTYQFFVEHGELKVYKTLDTPIFSTGKLILGPHQEKGKQHVGSDILVFYVNFGDLLCTLHETPYIITTGDSFYVPSGNYYNIKNLLNEESVLLFTQIKR
ncbi:centromere protein C isoform X2 [Zalophus californianus]|uniref:Centromere protein C n=1 Tax=Zalophus californianus TaxID=9704 RepID=A0A6P9F827_ZALCA|nr:centromere protein C isoform X2 [Zalophus californianus]